MEGVVIGLLSNFKFADKIFLRILSLKIHFAHFLTFLVSSFVSFVMVMNAVKQ